MRAGRREWLAFAALAALAATSRAETYTNLEYDFSVDLPLRTSELEARMSPEEDAGFKKAQEAWSRYRDSICAVLPEKSASGRASLAEDRVREIERMGEPDPVARSR